MNFILKKSIKLVSLLIAVSILSFILVSSSPVDPVRAYIGSESINVSQSQREKIETYWGLHESKTTQFFNWSKSLVQGNLGQSLIYRRPVGEIIATRFRASLALMSLAWVLSGVFGFTLGVLAGAREGSFLDRLIKGYCFALASVPAFCLGLILLMVFAVWLGWFPVGLASPFGGLAKNVTILEKIQHLLLPALTLSVVGVASIALHTREKLIDVMNSEFVRFAKAKGESGVTLLWRHGLRNITLPAISLHFASFGELFGGAILVEEVFSYPGLGQSVVKAGLNGDIPLLLGITIFSAIFIFIGNLIADLLYFLIDPRTKRKWSHG
ncbi:peptide/nickel transport system permease protein [Salegentibacter echinorum]|uniref:Peptide/nickel transport system permease protein n=1 Tax=Salegentibacter echinorum TaxID=1073325 RepID=A0A1M5K4E4_SALEC|nr:ABC transporter permease [Salegentibacter echinorum]SHG47654.1 peptide/nickel transport system permease protein [Salegentibacter echinorum]